jgi:hypothetical protein
MTDSHPTAPAAPTHTEVHHVHYAQTGAAKNGLATAALILGILGFLFTGIPFFVGLFLGGILNILAFIFGIVGAVKSGKLPGNLGRGAAITGIILSCVAFISMFFGAGTVW